MPDTQRYLDSTRASVEKTRLESDVTVITVSGELDLASVDQLDKVIREAEASPTSWIVLDLDGVTFMDSTGLGLLLAARRRSINNGNRLRFVRSRHEQVTRLLSLTDTRDLLFSE